MGSQNMEQRRFPRVPIDNLITYVLVDDHGNEVGQGVGKALNVSQGGILVETKAVVSSRYVFLVSTGTNNNLIENIGKVVFSKKSETGDSYHIGISFRGDHIDNVKFRKELIRLYHQRHVLKLKN